MVYEIDGKYYVLANHKFYEVRVDKDSKDNYDVKLIEKAKTIEFNRQKSYNQITLEKAYNSKKNRNSLGD